MIAVIFRRVSGVSPCHASTTRVGSGGQIGADCTGLCTAFTHGACLLRGFLHLFESCIAHFRAQVGSAARPLARPGRHAVRRFISACRGHGPRSRKGTRRRNQAPPAKPVELALNGIGQSRGLFRRPACFRHMTDRQRRIGQKDGALAIDGRSKYFRADSFSESSPAAHKPMGWSA